LLLSCISKLDIGALVIRMETRLRVEVEMTAEEKGRWKEKLKDSGAWALED
jgi:hypothetical protein